MNIFEKYKEAGYSNFWPQAPRWKHPTVMDAEGRVQGISRWTSRDFEEKNYGEQHPDSGVCLRTDIYPTIDIDLDDPTQASLVEELATRHLGRGLVRGRPNSSRVSIIYHCPEGFEGMASVVFSRRYVDGKAHTSAVEFLGKGKQTVIEGIHSSGVPHYFPEGFLKSSELPVVTLEQLKELRKEIIELVPEDAVVEDRNGQRHQARNQQSSGDSAISHRYDMFGDEEIELDGHTIVTVQEILDNFDEYEGTGCYDPHEPEYQNNSRMGQFLITKNGKRVVYSFAHSGTMYYLHPEQTAAIETPTDTYPTAREAMAAAELSPARLSIVQSGANTSKTKSQAIHTRDSSIPSVICFPNKRLLYEQLETFPESYEGIAVTHGMDERTCSMWQKTPEEHNGYKDEIYAAGRSLPAVLCRGCEEKKGCETYERRKDAATSDRVITTHDFLPTLMRENKVEDRRTWIDESIDLTDIRSVPPTALQKALNKLGIHATILQDYLKRLTKNVRRQKGTVWYVPSSRSERPKSLNGIKIIFTTLDPELCEHQEAVRQAAIAHRFFSQTLTRIGDPTISEEIIMSAHTPMEILMNIATARIEVTADGTVSIVHDRAKCLPFGTIISSATPDYLAYRIYDPEMFHVKEAHKFPTVDVVTTNNRTTSMKKPDSIEFDRVKKIIDDWVIDKDSTLIATTKKMVDKFKGYENIIWRGVEVGLNEYRMPDSKMDSVVIAPIWEPAPEQVWGDLLRYMEELTVENYRKRESWLRAQTAYQMLMRVPNAKRILIVGSNVEQLLKPLGITLDTRVVIGDDDEVLKVLRGDTKEWHTSELSVVLSKSEKTIKRRLAKLERENGRVKRVKKGGQHGKVLWCYR